jgi:AcrR family transcriptional regulator
MKAIARRRPVRQRRRPHQQRSERRLREILDVTARLLERYGPDKLTTNHVAAELGVSVGTLYHYFPNKHSILHMMGVEWLKEWERAFDGIEALSLTGTSLRQFTDDAVERLLDVYLNQRGVLHLVQSMFTITELHELDARSDEMAVTRLASVFRRLGVAGPPAELQRRARVFLKLTNSLLLEVVKQKGAVAKRTLDDLKSLLHHELTR